MELDEILALMAASIFAADGHRYSENSGEVLEARKRAVRNAEILWAFVLDRKEPAHG